MVRMRLVQIVALPFLATSFPVVQGLSAFKEANGKNAHFPRRLFAAQLTCKKAVRQPRATDGTNETTNWDVNCRDIIIPVNVTQSAEGGFSMEEYRLEILFALGEREALVDGQYELSARYCEPAPGIEPKKTLQVLAHGATFNKIMWDFPFKPETYSWTRYMTLEGYSTLAVDLVGAGNSTHPHSLLEAQTETYVQTLHQVLGQARSGSLLPRNFSRIALVGFSIGGITANSIAEKFPEAADGVILLGISWQMPYIYPSFLTGLQVPARDADPAQWAHLDPFYQTHGTLTTRRVANFVGDYEEGALQADFATRDLDTLGAAVTFTFHLVTAPEYTGPVFLGIGGNDASFCGRKCGAQPYALYDRFPAASDHVVRVYPDTGHALLYHRQAPAVMRDASEFLRTYVD